MEHADGDSHSASGSSQRIGKSAEIRLRPHHLECTTGRHCHRIRHLTTGDYLMKLVERMPRVCKAVIKAKGLLLWKISNRQDGLMQRSIREVNSSSRACVLWDLDEDTHYSVQVQSIGLQGDSQPSHTVHFRTLEKTDHYPIGSIDDDPTMEGMDLTPNLQTGELLIVTTVLLLWAAVIALFCRQYDIIKDNDYKDKPKRPSVRTEPSYYSTSVSAQSTPLYYNGGVQGSKFHRTSSSSSIIRV
ncbi:fibronectin type III domain-containing protein 4 isoform X3 [Oncorhynchus mykiss]|uniref:fibronectin type III domain-containing protein 4 isoform X3 n=1 Tax=Oncorhynchus mykiss TaxID=8022 RepID=UPI001878EC40|nr:fibronectin type III domain-containing protein 4 isoform X3 [Oncorhynchus mykiss]